ncbi:MAG TPA: hypothetical protein PLE35_11625, partial [Lentisphaeria bacterium]|nr:hypothetical protein [Lentisphaeria bacterium]
PSTWQTQLWHGRRISFTHTTRQNISHGDGHVSSYGVGEVGAIIGHPSRGPEVKHNAVMNTHRQQQPYHSTESA